MPALIAMWEGPQCPDKVAATAEATNRIIRLARLINTRL